ncbi:MAG: regulatory iron-sulfur-containing complex subunit RicT, partial [Pirellulales bacterium]
QIGARDEAARLGGIGSCGRELCCSTWLQEFKPVSTQAAKIQNLPLNPVRLSGQCGRLKCCLRYEYDTYEALQKDLPPIGADVVTKTGRARVLAQEILAGQLLIETEDRRRILIDSADVLTVLSNRPSPN